MSQLLDNTMKQGMYQTTNGATYFCKNWNDVCGNKNLDRPSEVLSFKGIFSEKIENSRLEKERIRRVIIQYYLEDNSLKINEPVQRNSGIRQGKFLLRQKVPKAYGMPGETIMPNDLIVGNKVCIFGRDVEILNCDEFTRNFYQEVLNIEMPDGFDWEKDNFEKEVLEKFKMKEYYGKKSWVNNTRVKCQKQFYSLDNKELKLFLESVDSGQEYLMFYFLADDSIELKVHNVVNRCKDLHLTYLKRRRVPAEFKVELPGINLESKELFNSF